MNSSIPMDAIYSRWDVTVRELGGGVWFFASLALSLSFFLYIVREWSDAKNNPVLAWVAIALGTFCFGSTIRGFLMWMQFRSLGNGWDASYWIATWPWFGLSVIFNIAGATTGVWFLAPREWKWCFAASELAISIAVPISVWYWL